MAVSDVFDVCEVGEVGVISNLESVLALAAGRDNGREQLDVTLAKNA